MVADHSVAIGGSDGLRSAGSGAAGIELGTNSPTAWSGNCFDDEAVRLVLGLIRMS